MVRSQPDTEGRWHAYENLRPAQKQDVRKRELTNLCRHIIDGPPASDHGVGPSTRPPARRVRGRHSGSSSSSARQYRDD
ncbi:hypothetical protein L6452_01695 [Arctium lappa]|uniref:Uncharacterized protein n=1 Tax=Arctium lappa TaxID=4217 RepID=A0ACB9FGT8_ARCLA|nr:hypothetical protein L6452_01695 [Arctium lappa]